MNQLRTPRTYSLSIRSLWLVSLVASALFTLTHSTTAHGQWRTWRGPNHNGIAAAGQHPVVKWSETENILWKTPIPGRGHSSPTVVGHRIVLTTADEQSQSQAVICFDRATGKQLWLKELNRGGFPDKIHAKNTHATPTVASDGELLFVSLHHRGKVELTALTLEGEQVWQQVAGDYLPQRYEYGYPPSPLIYQELLITCADFERGWLAAFDKATGKQVWRTKRPSGISYSSPIVAHVADRDQLLLTGLNQLISYDPSTGEQLWSTEVLTSATCGTVVWDDETIYASGGYPKAETAAIAADGSGRVLWRNREKCYEQSMLIHDRHVYAVNDRGIGFCWNAAEGSEMWSVRIGGGVSASPIFADGKIYSVNEQGTTTVFQATPEGFQPLAQNQLGNETFATPAIVDSKIYLRMADDRSGRRQEYLVCIGE